MCTVMLCACHKQTELYCIAHRAPVCGDCLCMPEHSTCQVKGCSEQNHKLAAMDTTTTSYCSLCSNKFDNREDPTIRLSCSHMSHARCYLQLLQKNGVAKGHGCNLCNSKVWPLDDNLNGKGTQEFPIEYMRDWKEGSTLPVPKESFSSNFDRNFKQEMIPNGNHSPSENLERNPISSISIDIASLDSIEKSVKIPKLSRLLSRKAPKVVNEEPNDEECGRGAMSTPKSDKLAMESHLACTTPKKELILNGGHNNKKDVNVIVPPDCVEGHWRKYKRSASSIFHPRKVLLFFATLSSIGTVILIYFTLKIARTGNTVGDKAL